MKKSIRIISGALLTGFLVAGCGSKSALDINVADLDTACDFVDALEQVIDEMAVLVEDNDLSEEEHELFDKLLQKGEEISDIAEEKHERPEGEACPNWDSMRDKSERVMQFR